MTIKSITTEEGEKYVDAGIRDLDEHQVIIGNADGFGACDITVGCHTLRWSEFDVLRKAMDLAEREWRKNKE